MPNPLANIGPGGSNRGGAPAGGGGTASQQAGVRTAQDNLDEEAERAAKRRAAAEARAGAGAPVEDDIFRDQQASASAHLAKILSGEVSATREQSRQLTEQAVGRQLGILSGGRPGQGASAARAASQTIGGLESGQAGQALTAGIQERESAARSLGSIAGQGREGDLGESDLAMRDRIATEQNRIDRLRLKEEIRQGKGPSMNERLGQAAIGLGTAALIGFSDERVKENIQPGAEDADAFLRAIQAFAYNYKDEDMGEGKQLGIMAQDLEKTTFGKQAVIETPRGKAVHYGKLAGITTASLARLHERLVKVEKGN